MNVLAELKDCYARFQKSESWPDELNSNQAKDRLGRFETRIASTISGLSMEKSRLETLVGHISNRKTLVSTLHSTKVLRWLTRLKLIGILDSQNVKMHMEIAKKAQASAEQAQVSANNMEKMTSHMQRIAEKTEQETVSMRIVTYLTLFFLPGTFVSVSNWLSALGR
jgi:methyl-accepting chemotaxis protein